MEDTCNFIPRYTIGDTRLFEKGERVCLRERSNAGVFEYVHAKIESVDTNSAYVFLETDFPSSLAKGIDRSKDEEPLFVARWDIGKIGPPSNEIAYAILQGLYGNASVAGNELVIGVPPQGRRPDLFHTIETLPPFPANVKKIRIQNLPKLKEIPELPDALTELIIADLPLVSEIADCKKTDILFIRDMPSLKRIGPMNECQRLTVMRCAALEELPPTMPDAFSLQILDCPLLSQISSAPNANYIEFQNLPSVVSLPPFPEALVFRISNLGVQQLPPFSDHVETLHLSDLPLQTIPELPLAIDMINLQNLQNITVLPRIPDLCNELYVVNCRNLTTLTPPVSETLSEFFMSEIFTEGSLDRLVPPVQENERMDEYYERMQEEAPAPTGLKWKGYTKGDEELFNDMFHAADVAEQVDANGNVKSPSADFSFCPVCLGIVLRGSDDAERGPGCMYMHHKCRAGKRHEGLYLKYRDAQGYIDWCTVCGRICKSHSHYRRYVAMDPDGFETVPPPPGVEMNFFGNDCKPYGGGGKVEKFVRMDALLQAACETQAQVNIAEDSVIRTQIVEQIWAAVKKLDSNPQTLAGAVRRAKKPIKARCTLPLVPPEPDVPMSYPDIVRPADEAALVPITHAAPDNKCVVELNEPQYEGKPVYQFQHKQEDGSVWKHENQYICAEDLTEGLTKSNPAGAFSGLCFIDPEHCKARFYPQEVRGIVSDEVYEKYKNQFNEHFAGQAGGAAEGLLYEIEPECLLPPKKAGKRKTYRRKRKVGASRKGKHVPK